MGLLTPGLFLNKYIVLQYHMIHGLLNPQIHELQIWKGNRRIFHHTEVGLRSIVHILHFDFFIISLYWKVDSRNLGLLFVLDKHSG